MSKLTQEQRQQLINKINTLPLPTILKYFQSREIKMKDVAHVIFPVRKEWLEEQLANMPNPIEQAEWDLIENLFNNIVSSEESLNELLSKLKAYIAKWEGICERHGTIANEKINWVQQQLNHLAEERESADWDSVDPLDKEQLIGHLTRYPNTVHCDDIDNLIWDLTNKEDIIELNNYKILFQNGLHVEEANKLLNAITEWTNIKNTNDIFMLNEYLMNNPNTPFKQQTNLLILELKQREIYAMRNDPTSYDVGHLMNLLKNKVFTEQELLNAHVMTTNILNTLKSTDIIRDLPDIKQAMESSTAVCKDGFTDVFFFGIPSTGKTCVLMGLSRASSLNINLASGGGDYASALQQYIDVGVTVPPTPGTFVTTLEAQISTRASSDIVHNVNLVEMSGEEFAFNIACNPEHVFTFEDMGTGTTELLQNDNRKVFFLIIDPTANTVRFTREVIIGYDEETGKSITNLKTFVVNQRVLIQKMVNLFQDPGNAKVMKKVDSIHIIMTKSDTLGNPIEREDKALNIFNEKYANSILGPLISLCKQYNINIQTDYHPKLYTFSLGTFYVGRLYEYEQTDSDRLVMAISHSTNATKKMTWWDKFKKVVNG